jgi:hypothetical protein
MCQIPCLGRDPRQRVRRHDAKERWTRWGQRVSWTGPPSEEGIGSNRYGDICDYASSAKQTRGKRDTVCTASASLVGPDAQQGRKGTKSTR